MVLLLGPFGFAWRLRGVAQLAEHRSPKPGVVSSSPTTPVFHGIGLFHWQGVLGGVVAEIIAGMFTASRYKRAQGKIARQATFAALVAVVGVGAWRLSEYSASDVMGSYVTPLIVFVAGLWVSFRVVNIPRFADFLISVEAEMNKVSWPSRSELFRASLVVIVVIFFLAATLFMYDVVLKWLLGNVMGLSA